MTTKLISLMATALALMLAVAVGPALAGKGHGGSGGGGSNGGGSSVAGPSITVNQSNPALGTSVTFTVDSPTNVKIPRVEVLCYQNDANGTPALVYGEAGSPDQAFLLGGGGSLWLTAGGAASCVANLYYFTWNAGTPATTYLATTSFNAAG